MGRAVPPPGVCLIGLGDELICAGEARKMRQRDARLVRVLDRLGVPRWVDLWGVCPDIAPRDYRGNMQFLRNAGRCRAYIDYPQSTKKRWRWKDYPPTPARVKVEPDERARGMILVEPHCKDYAPNKRWGWDNWQRLITLAPDLPWAQMGVPGSPVLAGARWLPTATPADALRLLAGARAAVLPEGFLHHAAAAVGLRSVVLYGAFITPRQTGYDLHTNICVDLPEAQGWLIPNALCQQAWKQITPEEVLCSLKTILS